MHISLIGGVRGSIGKRLEKVGIVTSEALLSAGQTPAGRRALASQIDADPGKILGMVNRAGLALIRGVGEVYGDLLAAAGVDSVMELSDRVPASLHARLVEHTLAGVARRAPTPAQVEDWIRQAKALGPLVRY